MFVAETGTFTNFACAGMMSWSEEQHSGPSPQNATYGMMDHNDP